MRSFQARSEEQVALHAYLTTITLNEENDSYEWIINGKSYNKYPIGMIYKKLLALGLLVRWYNMVWNSGGILKHNFLCWLLICFKH
ncbi:hypothetical protein YC2023_028369 [Brassica napus]